MSEFGALNRWVNKLLDGKVPAEREVKKSLPESQGEAERAPKGVNRRAVLAGGIGATVAGPEKTALTVVAAAVEAIPGATVIASGAGEISKDLIHKKIAQMASALGNDFILGGLEEIKNEVATFNAGIKIFSDVMSNGVSDVDTDNIFAACRVLDDSGVFNEYFSPELTIQDLSNKDLITSAYSLRGPRRIPGYEINIDGVSHLGESLQKTSGLSSTASLREVGEAIAKKKADFTKRILGDLDSFPTATKKRDALNALQQLLQNSDEPVQRDLYEEIIEAQMKNQSAYEKEQVRMQNDQEKKRIGAFNETLEKRAGIYCTATKVASVNHEPNATTYRIKPKGLLIWGVSRGLTRMHIEHWRQSEYAKAGKLADYVPGQLKIEERIEHPEDGILITTSDPLLLRLLDTAASKGDYIIMPNRLQDISHIKDNE
jgi:hypothetical protein